MKNPLLAKCRVVGMHRNGSAKEVSVDWTPTNVPIMEMPNRAIADAAAEFLRSAEMLTINPPQIPVRAVLMSVSFSLELFLKSMNAKLIYHGCEVPEVFEITSQPLKTGHDLVELFEELSPNIQRRINKAYRTRFNFPKGYTFRSALRPYRTVFEDIRYSFEKPSYRDRGSGLSLPKLLKLARFMADFVSTFWNSPE